MYPEIHCNQNCIYQSEGLCTLERAPGVCRDLSSGKCLNIKYDSVPSSQVQTNSSNPSLVD